MKEMNSSPPRLFLRFFRWFCHPKIVDYIEGDLMEVYKRRLKTSGKRKADFRFIIDVLFLFRPGIIKPVEGYRNLDSYGMYKSYFKIGLRNLLGNKGYALINIGGLAVAMACAVLILLHVRFELSYDRFHKHHEHVYRVLTQREINNDVVTTVNVSLLLADELVRSVPEVEAAARFGRSWPGAFRYRDKQFQESGFFITDASVIDVLDIKVLKGDLRKTLSDRNSIAITPSTAKKYFGEEDPLGKMLTYTFEESQDYTVSAIIESMPANSHVHFNLLASVESVATMPSWSYDFIPTYIRLKTSSNTKQINTKIASLVRQYYPEDQNVELRLQPMKAVHLHSHYVGELEVNSNMQSVVILSGIGLLLLILAGINFMNMATAQSTVRAREVGVRKVFGAVRFQLVRQFMFENMSIIFIAMVLGFVMVEVMLPYYNSFAWQSLSLSGFRFVEVFGAMLVIALLLGSFSSLYPAWFTSAYRPAKILRGLVSSSGGPGQFVLVRKVLITVQCSASLLLIICMMVMERQMRFLHTKDLGFAVEGVAYIRSPQNPINYEEFKSTLLGIPGIHSVTFAGRIPGGGQDLATAVVHVEGMADDQRVEIPTLWVGHDFANVFNIRLKEGRNFSQEFPNDHSESVLVNETAARLFWNSEEPGKKINLYRGGRQQRILETQVIGVVKDFHFQSLHQPIQPMVIRLGGYPTYLAFRYNLQLRESVTTELDKMWRKISPEWPLELNYVEDSANKLYSDDKKLSQAAKALTLVAIALACFGLFGLSIFTAQRKTKEIGIRKVLGASSAEILKLMIIDFTVLIGVAIVLASPIAFILAERWLASFAYHAPLSIWVFVGSSAIMLSIAIFSIGFESIKAALANPINSLKSE